MRTFFKHNSQRFGKSGSTFVTCILLLICWCQALNAQSPYTSLGSGNWNDDNTWSGAGIPGAGDEVTILGGHTVTLTANAACATLTVTGSLLIGDYTFTLSTDLLVAGSISMGSGILYIRDNDVTYTGSFSCGTGTVDFYRSGAQTIPSMTYYNLNTSTAGSKTLSGNIIIIGDLKIGAGTTLDVSAGNFGITIQGNWLHNGFFNQRFGTVSFTGSNIQQVSANSGETFYNLTINKAGGYVQPVTGNSLTITNNLLISNGTLGLGTSISTCNIGSTAIINGTFACNGTTAKTITINNTLSGSGTIDMSGGDLAHKLNLAGASNSIGTFISGTSNIVDYTLNGNQSIFSSDNYRHLNISGSGTKSINANTTVAGILTMSSGSINCGGSSVLTLSNAATGALVRSSGTIIGYLQRAIGVTGSEYLYPIGTTTSYNPVKITFNNLTSGYLIMMYNPGDQGTGGFPIDDAGVEVYDRYTSGYWEMKAVGPMATSSYNVNLNYTGFTGVYEGSRILRRDGTSLAVDGTHGSVVNPEITRNGLNGISTGSTYLIICKSKPYLTAQPTDSLICPNSDAAFAVEAIGLPALTYHWQQNTGSGFSDLSNGGVFSGVLTSSLAISGAPLSMNGYLYRCTVTDGDGYSTNSNSALLSVGDNEDPTISCVGNQTKATDANECFYTVSGTEFDPTATNDNCGVASVSNNINAGATLAGAQIPVGTTSITWTVTDGIGRTNTCSFDATVNEDQAPTFTAPADITIYKDGSCNYNAAIAITGDVTDEADNCDASLDATFSDVVTAGSCEGEEIITRTWTLTDDCGNNTQHVQVITASDNTVPTFTAPADITIYKDGSCNYNAAIAITGDVTDEADNCDASLDATFSDVVTAGSCEGEEIITRTWTLTDDCGNNTQHVQVITASDNTVPTFTVPPNDTICRDQICNYNINPAVTGDVVDENDNCSTGLNATYIDDVINLKSCDTVGYIIRKWILVDNCSNITEKTQIIWVEPTVTIDAAPESDTLCSGELTAIGLNSISAPIRPVQFRYETRIPFGVTVIPGSGNAISNTTVLTDVVQNSTDTAKRVLFIITPYTRHSGNETEKCAGVADTVEIWVEPVPKVSLIPHLDTICTSLRPSVNTSSVTRSLQPVRLYYETLYNIPEVEVFYDQDTFDLVPGFSMIDSIVNYSNIPQQVTLIVYPYLMGTGGIRKCSGIADTSYIWIAPKLKVIIDTVSTYIGGQNIRCFSENNGFIRLKPEGGIIAFEGYDDSDLTYSWNNDWRVTRDINSLVAGNYLITISDGLGCLDDSLITLVQPATLESYFKIVDVLSCHGKDGTIAPITTGGNPSYSYVWDPPDDYDLHYPVIQDTLFNIIDGWYKLKVTDTNGCWIDVDTIINQPQAVMITFAPDVYYGRIDDPKYEIKCYGENTGRLFSYNKDELMLEYTLTRPDKPDTVFSNNDKLIKFSNLPAGHYTLAYTDTAGCSNSSTADLHQPDLLKINQVTLSEYAGAYNVSCFGAENGSISLNDISGGHYYSPYKFDWETLSGSGTTIPTDRNQFNLAAGVYSVTVTDTFNCAVVDTFELIQPDEFNINIEIQIIDSISCNLASDGQLWAVPSGGISPYNYSWEDGPQTQSYSGIGEGTYCVAVTDDAGCVGHQSITFDDPDPLKADYIVTNTSCFKDDDGSVLLNALGGTKAYHYFWNNGGISNNKIENLVAGSYNLEIRDANNCRADTVVIVNEPEKLSVALDERYTVYPFCPDWQNGALAISINGGTRDYTYIWTGYPEVNDSILNNIKEDSYSIRIIDANACIADTIFRLKALNNSCLGIPTAFTPNYDYENDTWDISYINEYGGEASFHEVYPNGVIQIYDRLGNLVYRCTGGCNAAWTGEDTKGRALPVDTYYYVIELNTDDGQAPLKGIVTIIR